jgi:hypothetical protein
MANKGDLGTYSYLQTGWWILHVVAIAAAFYLGHLLWPAR